MHWWATCESLQVRWKEYKGNASQVFSQLEHLNISDIPYLQLVMACNRYLSCDILDDKRSMGPSRRGGSPITKDHQDQILKGVGGTIVRIEEVMNAHIKSRIRPSSKYYDLDNVKGISETTLGTAIQAQDDSTILRPFSFL